MGIRISFLGLVLISLGLSACSGFLYYPTRTKYVNEKLLNFKPQEVEMEIAGGPKVYAWLFQAKPPQSQKPLILFFHGNGQNVSSHFYSLYWILKEGYDFLILDYPGYGRSEGEPNPKNTVQVGHAAIKWVTRFYPKRRIAVFSQSLGGAVAMRSLIEAKPNFVPCQFTVEASFDSYQEVARDALKKNWFTWPIQWLSYLVLSDRHSPEGRVGEISPTPTMVLHSEKDPIVSSQFSRKIYEELKDPKKLIVTPDDGHAKAFTGPEKEKLQKVYLEQLEKYCSPFSP